MDPPELLRLIARSLVADDNGPPLPMRLCKACVDAFQARGGALTVSPAHGERAAVSTPGVFEELEPLQVVLGEGPVHQAMAENRPIVLRAGGVAHEFPVFSQVAGSVARDVTLYAVPMRAGDSVMGALSLYGTGGLQVRSMEQVQFVADAIGTFLLGDISMLDWSESAQFHQATGVLVARLGVVPDDASALMRARAFSRSVSLRSVARDVRDGRLTLSDDE